MIFNSINFIYFIIPALILYWLAFKKTNILQNIFLLISSLIFYAIADWRFMFLLLLSTFINFYLGKKIFKAQEDSKRNVYLYIGLLFNIGLLLYFKYFNFFLDGFFHILNVFGRNSTYNTLTILLPLGISFFTFQTLGYLIDVFNEEIEPSENILEFSVFITFFPKILSGPIERFKNLMPQIKEKKNLSYDVFVDGLRQILWGLFAKIVIAENCAAIVDPIFNNYQDKPGSVLLIATFFYAIQLYADFAGYSNMAIGVSKLFGLQLMRNFSTPFFSTNISDFWRKWHISLTTWMMDYVFTPLSFTLRKHQKKGLIISIIITFILVGFWHGANWTFVIYGLLHGMYFIPLVFSGKINSSSTLAQNKWFPSLKDFLKMVALFILVMLTDVFFRASSVFDAINYLNKIFSITIFSSINEIIDVNNIMTLILIAFFILIEWINQEKKHDFEIHNWSVYLRWSSYLFIFLLILFFGKSSETFIYFQF